MALKTKYHVLRPLDTEPLSSMHGWTKWLFWMLIGSFFGRTFYYIGFPPAKMFIGDIVLVLFFLFCPREFCDRWFSALTKRSAFGPFAWLLLLSMLYGLSEVLYGIYLGYPLLTTLENLVFNLYPAYFFLGVWVGTDHPTLYQKVIRCYAWMLAIYGPLYLLYLHNVKLSMPFASDVPVFGQTGGGGFIILSLLALERKPSRFWLPIVFCAIMLLAVQERTEWISTLAGFMVWGMLERKMKNVVSMILLVAVLLLAGFVADVDLPSTAERGGSISSREIVARGLSAISPQLAEQVTDSKNTNFYAGTISWRTEWWSAIWDSVNESMTKSFIGNGYGFPLKNLVPYLKDKEIRTPHSIFFFALGYSGWIGVVLFFSLQFSILAMLWRVYRLTGQSYGVAVWVVTVLSSFFGNSFESPMGAIPYYLMVGLLIGPILCGKLAVLSPTVSRQRIAEVNLAAKPA